MSENDKRRSLDLDLKMGIIKRPNARLYNEALRYYDAREFEKSIDIIHDLFKYDPEDVEVLQLYARNLLMLGRYEEARGYTLKALSNLESKTKSFLSEKPTSKEDDELLQRQKILSNQLKEIQDMMKPKESESSKSFKRSATQNMRQQMPVQFGSQENFERMKDKLENVIASQETSAITSPHTANDTWTTADSLGYGIYAYAIYTFLTHKETHPPLAISIQAPWGGGKTSIMRMIQKNLDPSAPDLTKDKPMTDNLVVDKSNKNQQQPTTVETIRSKFENNHSERKDSEKEFKIKNGSKMLTIWFNAWKYQSTEQIWAGLADAIITQFSKRLEPDDRQRFLLELNLRRVGKDQILRKINDRVFSSWWKKVRKWCWTYLTGIGSSAIWFFIETTGAVDFISKPFGEMGVLLFSLAGAGIIAIQRNEAVSSVDKEDANEVLGEFFAVPDYSANLGFIHHVDADILRVLSIIDDLDLKLVVFIDDLDRCSPSNIAKVIEGVNMFISAEYRNCYLVVGMDAEIVAAALEKAHSNVIEKLPAYSKTGMGWRFMDKFVQLPVIIPPPEKENVTRYVNSLLVLPEKDTTEGKVIEEIAGKILFEKQNPYFDDDAAKKLISNEIIPYDVRADLQDAILRRAEALVAQRRLDNAFEVMDCAKLFYSDSNLEIQKEVTKAVSNFSNNPREMKRFLNVLRFNYFIREGRKALGFKVPTMEQLGRWIVLTMKWPDFVLWLHKRSGGIGFDKDSESGTHKILGDLMDNSRDLNTWITKVKELLKINTDKDDDNISWLTDESLRRFFEDENKQTDKISNAIDTGLY